jgi:hypothetical protein
MPDVILIVKSMDILKILSIILLSISSFSLFAQEVEKSEKSDYRVLAFRVENDIYFSDRYYTNGLKFSYTQDGDDFFTSRLQFAVLKAIFGDDAQAYQSISIGQNMNVSSDRSIVNPPDDDRPYAGWLYASFGSHLARENSLDSLSISLGIVGPHSYAGDLQVWWHDLIGVDRPMGWHNQIKDEFGFIVSYEHSERILRRNISEDFATDTIATLGADLGNVITQGFARAIWRFGFNLPYSLSANRIDNSNANDVQWRPTDASPDWHCFMYAGGSARFVGYDITLNGNTFRDSRSVAQKWLVGEAMVGISSRYKNFQADLNWTLRTSEYHNQEYSPHMFWSVALKVFF